METDQATAVTFGRKSHAFLGHTGMYRQYLTRDRLAFVASVVASARACQDSVPLVSRWYAVPASTMGEALYATRSRELKQK